MEDGDAPCRELIANDAVAPRHLPAVVGTFSQQAEVLDEATQLKCLQGVLTVLQSSVCPEEEDAMSPMLSMCFRLLSAARGGGGCEMSSLDHASSKGALRFQIVKKEAN